MARKGAKDRGLFERPKGSEIWWICYADANGKTRREKVGMKNAAKKLYGLKKKAIREHRLFPELAKQKITFKDIADEALTRSRTRNASWKDDASRGRDLIAAFGDRLAADIGPRELEEWMTKIQTERSLAPSTVNKYRALLSSIYSLAVRNEDVSRNPVKLTEFRPENNARVRWLSDEEEERLLAVLSPAHQGEVLFSLHTGLRQANQFNLKWSDIDMERGFAFIAHTKNGRPQYVHFNSRIMILLRELPRTGEYVFEESLAELKRNHRLNWWYRALEECGLENFRWHDLRHTFASRLAMLGHDMRTLQTALHHQTPSMTMRYAHLSEDHMREALESLVPSVSSIAVVSGV